MRWCARCNAFADRGVDFLTVFAFSSENWKRPSEEVSGLMGLVLVAVSKYLTKLAGDGVRVRIVGDRSKVSEQVARCLGTRRAQHRAATRASRCRWPSTTAAAGTSCRPAGAPCSTALRAEALDEAAPVALHGAELMRPTRTCSSAPAARCASATSCSGKSAYSEFYLHRAPVARLRRDRYRRRLPGIQAARSAVWWHQTRRVACRKASEPACSRSVSSRQPSCWPCWCRRCWPHQPWPFNVLTLLLIGAAGWEWGRLNQAGQPLSVSMGLALAAACGAALLGGWAAAAPVWVWWCAAAGVAARRRAGAATGPGRVGRDLPARRAGCSGCWRCGRPGWRWRRRAASA